MSASAKAQQMVQIQLPHDVLSKPLYGTVPFMSEYTITLDDAAKLLADLQIVMMGA